MALWTWWPGDALPALRGLDAFNVDRFATVDELSLLTGLGADEINKRIQDGNTCYLARLNGAPVAYGWVARSAADIGELELPFHVDERNRCLWDFQTVPSGVDAAFIHSSFRRSLPMMEWRDIGSGSSQHRRMARPRAASKMAFYTCCPTGVYHGAACGPCCARPMRGTRRRRRRGAAPATSRPDA